MGETNWAEFWAQVAAAGAGAWAGYKGQKDQNEIMQAASGPQPWESQSRMDQGPMEDYNIHGVNAAYDLFNTPGIGTVDSSIGHIDPSVGRLDASYGQLSGMGGGGMGGGRGRRGGGGGGGGGGMGGASANSQALADAGTQWALGGNPTLDSANQFSSNLLAGNAPNSYMDKNYDWAQNGPLSQLFGQAMGGMSGGGGGAGGGSGFGGSGGSWSDMGYNPATTDAHAYANQWLGDPNDPNGIMGTQLFGRLSDMGERAATSAGQQAMRDAGLAATGSGRFGGGAHGAATGHAAGQMAQGIQDAQTQALMQMAGMGQGFLGQAIGGMGQTDSLNASGRMNAANNSAANSRFGASLGQQERLGMGNLALQAALGQGGMMQGIGSDMLGAQMGALGNANTLQGLPMQNMQGAFGMTNAIDQQAQQAQQARAAQANAMRMHNSSLSQQRQMHNSDMNAQMQMYNAGLDQQAQLHNAGLDWQGEMFNSQVPWQNMGYYADMMGSFGPNFMTGHQSGTNAGAPYNPGNPWLAAMQGGMGAASLTNDMFG